MVDDGRRWPFPEGRPHDGILRDGLRWFTTVEGWVLGCDPVSGARVERHRPLADLTGRPGWVRGLEVVGDTVFLGVTTLRAGRAREVISGWIRGSKHPTRVVAFGRSDGRLRGSWEVGARGEGTLYSVIRVPGT